MVLQRLFERLPKSFRGHTSLYPGRNGLFELRDDPLARRIVDDQSFGGNKHADSSLGDGNPLSFQFIVCPLDSIWVHRQIDCERSK